MKPTPLHLATLLFAWLALGGPLHAQSPLTLTAGVATGAPGSQAEIPITLDHTGSEPILAWTFGICHDPALVDPVAIADGSTTLVSDDGGPADFSVFNFHPGGVTVGVVVDLDPPLTPLPPGLGYELHVVTYDIVGTAPSVASLDPCDTLGNPAIGIVFALGTPPVSTSAEVVAGAITIEETDCNGNGQPDSLDLLAGTSEDCNGNGVPDECDIADGLALDSNGNGIPDDCEATYYQLRVSSESGFALSPVETVISLDHSWDPIAGWSFGICHDPTKLDFAQIALGSTTLVVDSGTPPDFYSTTEFAEGVTVAAVFDFDPPFSTLPSGVDYELYRVTYTGVLPGLTEVSICGTLGSPVVPVVISAGGVSYLPGRTPGVIEVLPGPSYLRGECDGDGVISASDAVRVLYILFGLATGPCLDACDPASDGTLDLSDALYLLAYLFQSGPPPVAPFPSCAAGAIALGCETPPPCP